MRWKSCGRGRSIAWSAPIARWEEKMTLFWHGLFTSGLIETKNPNWIVAQDALLRREAMGNYKRLTHAIIHDPAMIKYLNNDDNVKGHPMKT